VQPLGGETQRPHPSTAARGLQLGHSHRGHALRCDHLGGDGEGSKFNTVAQAWEQVLHIQEGLEQLKLKLFSGFT